MPQNGVMTDNTLPTSRAQTEIGTPNASKYLQQLCKHFGHKVPASFESHKGSITFPAGQCELTATDNALTMRLATADGEALTRLQGVMADHLVRFAFREELNISWTPQG